MQSQSLATPFTIRPYGRHPGWIGRLASATAPILDPLLGLTALDRLYAALPHGNFIDRAIERLNVTVSISDEDLRQVPASGPAIVVCNHPSGALDGLALAHAVLRRRSDVRLLGNHLLSRVPEMRDWMIALNPFEQHASENRRGLRAARQWLAGGGVLIVFPAGEVSNVEGPDGFLIDPDWQPGVLGLARWSDAPIVPAFIDARASRWFRLAGRIHPRLRTALLPRELLRVRNRSVSLRIGSAVTAERIARLPGAAAQLEYLRARAYALGSGDAVRPRATAGRAIVPPVSIADLERDIAALSPAHELLRSGDYSVFCAPAALMPALLREIGRLREVSFRAAGEGTGLEIDLDRFDLTYDHLFVWTHARRELVGAYRIGATDRVCGVNGRRGLYSHTLFELAPEMLDALGPSLELGRSFVRPEYQRQSNALLLLWKGIGALVARAPRYRRLFGPVSISARYSHPARALVAAFLESAATDTSWRRYVRPRRPFVRHRLTTCAGLLPQEATLNDVDDLVREFGEAGGVPVLMRQYWKLGAEVLGLSVDPAFGHCLDGLMMIDLTRLPAVALHRYLGREGAAAFLGYHGRRN